MFTRENLVASAVLAGCYYNMDEGISHTWEVILTSETTLSRPYRIDTEANKDEKSRQTASGDSEQVTQF